MENVINTCLLTDFLVFIIMLANVLQRIKLLIIGDF